MVHEEARCAERALLRAGLRRGRSSWARPEHVTGKRELRAMKKMQSNSQTVVGRAFANSRENANKRHNVRASDEARRSGLSASSTGHARRLTCSATRDEQPCKKLRVHGIIIATRIGMQSEESTRKRSEPGSGFAVPGGQGVHWKLPSTPE